MNGHRRFCVLSYGHFRHWAKSKKKMVNNYYIKWLDPGGSCGWPGCRLLECDIWACVWRQAAAGCGRDQRRGGLFKAIFGSARCQQTQVRRPISPAADPLLELETSLREVRSLKFHNHQECPHYGLVKSYSFQI